MPHIPRDKFTRWNHSHSILLSSRLAPLFNILRHAARFTVLLIRQRQLVSKDTLYINFGYYEGVVHQRPFYDTAVQPLPVSLYCGFGHSGRGFSVDSEQRGVYLSSGTSRAPSVAGKQETWNELLKKPAKLKGMARNAPDVANQHQLRKYDF